MSLEPAHSSLKRKRFHLLFLFKSQECSVQSYSSLFPPLLDQHNTELQKYKEGSMRGSRSTAEAENSPVGVPHAFTSTSLHYLQLSSRVLHVRLVLQAPVPQNTSAKLCSKPLQTQLLVWFLSWPQTLSKGWSIPTGC